MHTLGDIYGQFMLRLCLWCLGSIAAGVAFCVLASIAKRYAKLVRRVGLFAAILLSTFIFGMIREGAVTQEDKEEYRAAMAPILEERAAIARILLPSDGDLPRADSSLAEMNADPPRSAPETTWQSFSHWSHGVYMGGERVDFAPGWVFPYGSNHLSSVEVMAWGEILSNSRSLTPIASLGRRVSLLPDVSSFQYGLTPSNTYAFAWNGARDGRIDGEPFDGIIELFRHGDISVTTNGVTEVYPRILPFSHDGFGQDDEWVAANFTNATEIAAAGGYAAWVDAQVGSGVGNGLYKLTATLLDNPLETSWLTVGGVAVCVTNAGDYVFLLEKGVEYEIEISPSDADFEFSAVDDVPTGIGALSEPNVQEGLYDGRWTDDDGGFEISVELPVVGRWLRRGGCVWRPSLHVTPSVWQPTPGEPTETFTAVVEDVPPWMTPSYVWHSDNAAVVSIATPTEATTQMTCHFPTELTLSTGLDLTVTIGDCTLSSVFVPLQSGEDQSAFLVSAPSTMFINNDDDNRDGRVDWVRPLTSPDDDIVRGKINILSRQPTNGTVRIDSIAGLVGTFDMPDDETGIYDVKYAGTPVPTEEDRHVDFGSELTLPLWFNPSTVSTHYNGSNIKVSWTPDGGETQSYRKRFTVVEPIVEPINNGVTNVVEDGVSHCYTVNPCGVAVGRRGYFSIELRPSDYPDEEIVWSAEGSGGVSFPEGNTGRKVAVEGVSTGTVDVVVHIGDCQSDPPKFKVYVVNEKVVDIRAWLISNKNGDTAFSEEEVRQMVRGASDIYAQVGVSLNLVEPITVTNIPAAYDASYNSLTNGYWAFDQIVDIASNTGGIECYFINSFIDYEYTVAANSINGMVITSRALSASLAHEIGHAFGLHDIYRSNSQKRGNGEDLLEIPTYVKASSQNVPSDWNGGCDGRNSPGTRYYEYGCTMHKLYSRMMMNGVKSFGDVGRDITAGNVYGVGYYYLQGQRVWFVNEVAVGFMSVRNNNPQHQ